MKKILFIGPIGGMYGRDIELNLVANAIKSEFKISFFSTGIWLKNSVSTKHINNPKQSSLNSKLMKNPIIFILCLIAWSKNRFKGKFKDSVFNKLSKWFINIFSWDLKIIEKEIKDNDMVICFVQLGSAYLSDIIEISKKYKCKVIVRTTGVINNCPIDLITLKKVDLFIHHSKKNKNKLVSFINHNYKIIDQCAINEKRLLNIKPKHKKIRTFLTIGRLVKEKNIDKIIYVFNKLEIENIKLYVLGDGPEIKNLNLLNKNKNVKIIGYVDNFKLHKIFSKVDCIVIPFYKLETGPLTGIEAMASGKIIISSNTGAMPERLGGYAFWYNNLAELKKSFQKVINLNENEVYELSNSIKNIYRKKYSKEIISNEYLSTITDLIYKK
jgi:glycosyltransferase involved in cell wall biosynthesis